MKGVFFTGNDVKTLPAQDELHFPVPVMSEGGALNFFQGVPNDDRAGGGSF